MRRLVAEVQLSLVLLVAGSGSALSQSVTLAWDPSPDPDVVGYHLYYGVASQTYTNFVALGQATTTTISNLTSGLIYFFAATTIDSMGLESEFSGEVAYGIGPLACDIAVTNLLQPYDGTAKTISVSTDPPNLPVSVTYGGQLNPPSAVGQYPFIALFTEGGCIGGVTGVLTIEPGPATVELTNLNQTYDGTARPAVVNTTPANLALSITYNGQTNAPTQAGAYEVAATVLDPNYAGAAIGTLTVAPMPAEVLLGNLVQTYSGTPGEITATTTPPGLPLLFTYNGVTNAPADAGTYDLSATVDDPNYLGSTNAVLTINQAQVAVELSNLSQVYDGTRKTVSAVTVPPNTAVLLTYNGHALPPVNAGSYLVKATIPSGNYTGGATGTFTISKANAPVRFTNVDQIYNGMPKPIGVTTQPPGLNVVLTYSGQNQVPFAVGRYVVNGTVEDPNYSGSAAGTLTIAASAPNDPNSPNTSGDGNGPAPNIPVLFVSWPLNPAGLTIWQSSDLATWTPLTNLSTVSSSFAITPAPNAHFFRATAVVGDATQGVPLSIGK